MAVAELERRDGSLTSADGTRLFWQAWEVESPKATFAVVHGLGEHGGRYRRFAEAMGSRGFSTFAIDLRGMGRSEGPRGFVSSWAEWLKDTETFVGMVAEHPSAGEVIPLGHSVGGVVVLSAILRDALLTPRFVVSNPALRIRMPVPGWKLSLGRVTSRLVPRLAMANGVDAARLSRDPEVVDAYRADPLVHDRITSRLFTEWMAATDEILARAGEIKTPFLALVAEEDGIIDPEGTRELHRRAAPSSELVTLPGRYHEPFNDLEADEVFDALAGWASGRAPAPAS